MASAWSGSILGLFLMGEWKVLVLFHFFKILKSGAYELHIRVLTLDKK